MEDYTKYRLKEAEELAPYIAQTDNVFVIACNKCFKAFETVDEPDGDNLAQIIRDAGKTVTGIAKVDFLCNAVQTEKKLKELVPEGTEHIFVAACGLGIQTTASVADVPVYAGSNSLNYTGHHGMALTKKACDACAQCFLNITGGVCPIVDCSKSLVNGQCGGAKNGKCEVDPEKDCAWEKIQQRLGGQNRVNALLSQPVQIRDYSKINYKVISEYVNAARERRLDGYYGGVHPSENKEFSEHIELKPFPQPDTVTILMSMHTGKPATPCVEVGDHVKLGQKIGEQNGFISACIHSSVSGEVIAIEPHPHPITGAEVPAIVIRNDKLDTPCETIRPNRPLEELTPDEITNIVQESGIVGMGGASFPTYVKLKPGKPIDAVLLNGCECEPYLTADHKVLLAYADDIIYGLKAIMKAVDAPRGIIVIEDNKPDAIALMQEKIAGEEGVEVLVAKTKYPQGAEKMLIKRALGRQVPRGGLPADAGAVVSNVSTAKAIADAITKGMPLIERVVSVTGENIANPGNYIVKVGTNVQELVDYCGGFTKNDVVVKMGGAMMGAPLTDLNVSVMKSTNGIIAIDTDVTQTVECIKCGRCVDVCPMELMPLYFQKYADEENWDAMNALNVRDCIECRSCEYICSSKIPLVTKIKAGKGAIMAAMKK